MFIEAAPESPQAPLGATSNRADAARFRALKKKGLLTAAQEARRKAEQLDPRLKRSQP